MNDRTLADLRVRAAHGNGAFVGVDDLAWLLDAVELSRELADELRDNEGHEEDLPGWPGRCREDGCDWPCVTSRFLDHLEFKETTNAHD